MKLKDLAAKPQLIKIAIDREDIIEKYGEAVEFWMYDRQSIEQFIKLSSVSYDNPTEVINAVKNIILNEDGSVIINDDETLPPDILMAAVNEVISTLGKS